MSTTKHREIYYSSKNSVDPVVSLAPLRQEVSAKRLIFYYFISAALVIAYACKFLMLPYIEVPGQSVWYYGLLINYAGGFVRRGLMGQILLWIYDGFGVHPFYVLSVICIAAYMYVTAFLFNRFHNRRLCWWILLTPLLCAFVNDIIRRDYIGYAMMIWMLMLCVNPHHRNIRIIIAAIIGVVSLLMHEAFIFWGIPTVILILVADKSTRKWGVGLTAIFCLVFSALCYYKGNLEIENAIVGSWQGIVDFTPTKGFGTKELKGWSALAWQLKPTIVFHLYTNYATHINLFVGVLIRAVTLFILYYLLTRLVFVVRNRRITNEMSEDDYRYQGSLSGVVLLIMICCIPLLTILSCDSGRVFQYISMASICTFVTVPKEQFVKLWPQSILKRLIGFNKKVDSLIKHKAIITITLMLCFGQSPYNMRFNGMFNQSPVGAITYEIVDKFIPEQKHWFQE